MQREERCKKVLNPQRTCRNTAFANCWKLLNGNLAFWNRLINLWFKYTASPNLQKKSQFQYSKIQYILPSSDILKKWKIPSLPLVTTLSWTYFPGLGLTVRPEKTCQAPRQAECHNSLLSLETKIQYQECEAQWVGLEEYREEVRTRELMWE